MATRAEAVLLLHGLWMNRLAMLFLERSLDRAGFMPVSLAYRSMRGTSDEHVAAVARRIASIPADTVHLVGHSLGGVVALGCTVGQGLSGVSTLAAGSFLTFFAIVAGATLTMKIQYWRLMREI